MIFFKKNILLDVATPWQLGFQDPATPIMEGIIQFYNEIIFFVVMIVTFVSWMLFRILFFFSNTEKNIIYNRKEVVHGVLIEIIWTLIPSLILLIICTPSVSLLYSMDEIISPLITLKVIGNQWYWTYEYSDYNNEIVFDSYMIQEEDLNLGQYRLLEVDNRIVLPINTHIRVLVTSSDVLHSWAIPSLGVKMDACPGRLNQISMFIKREGVFYGQCSEICGINHAFMPIVVESTSLEKYTNWIMNKKDNY